MLPHGEHGSEQFSLGVEPGVPHAPGPYFAGFVKFSHGLALVPFANACPPSMIGKVFKFAVATPSVEPFIAERFVVAGSAGDAKAAVTVEGGNGFETVRVLDEGTKDGRTNFADARSLLEECYFRKLKALSVDFVELVFPHGQGGVENEVELVEPCGSFFRDESEPAAAFIRMEDFLAVDLHNTESPVAGFDQGFEFALLIA